jgi:hypothetical protein
MCFRYPHGACEIRPRAQSFFGVRVFQSDFNICKCYLFNHFNYPFIFKNNFKIKKLILISLVMPFFLGLFMTANAQNVFPPFYKLLTCEVRNEQGDVVQYGNDCEFGNRPCIPNPCGPSIGG